MVGILRLGQDQLGGCAESSPVGGFRLFGVLWLNSSPSDYLALNISRLISVYSPGFRMSLVIIGWLTLASICILLLHRDPGSLYSNDWLDALEPTDANADSQRYARSYEATRLRILRLNTPL